MKQSDTVKQHKQDEKKKKDPKSTGKAAADALMAREWQRHPGGG